MKNDISLLTILICIFAISCTSNNSPDPSSIIRKQKILKEDIIVYNVNKDLTKGQGFRSNYDMFISIDTLGINFDPVNWNSKMTASYGIIKKRSNINGKLLYEFDANFMRSSSPNSAISQTYPCILKAEVDSVKKKCDITILLDIDSLIFEMQYK